MRRTAAMSIDSDDHNAQRAATTGAARLDIASQVIVDACAELDLPFLSLRAISDTASEPFPAPAHVLFNVEKQKTDFARLAFYLVTHPGAFSRLNAFRERVAVARKALADTLATIFRADLL